MGTSATQATGKLYELNFGGESFDIPWEPGYYIERITGSPTRQYNLLDPDQQMIEPFLDVTPFQIGPREDPLFSGDQMILGHKVVHFFTDVSTDDAIGTVRPMENRIGAHRVWGSSSRPLSNCPPPSETNKYTLSFPHGELLGACRTLHRQETTLEIRGTDQQRLVVGEAETRFEVGLKFDFVRFRAPSTVEALLLLFDQDLDWMVGLLSARSGGTPNTGVFGGESDGGAGGGG